MNGDETGGRFALFPLNLVLFPGGLLPLRIFEPRYQRMVSECLRDQRPFVVVAIVDGPEAGGIAATATTGTLTRIIDFEQLEDGLLGLLCEGESVVGIGDIEAEKDNRLRAVVAPMPAAAEAPLPEAQRWMADLLGELLDRIGAPFDRLVLDRPSADHVANRLIELLPLPVAEKQRLFDLPDGGRRLDSLAGMLSREDSRD
jgi:Lon protease-like protein